MKMKASQIAAAAASLIAGFAALTAVSPAYAGSCPAGKMGTDLRQDPKLAASGVTDTVISSIDVAKEPAAIDGRSFRLRRLVIQPGGVVPWHSHGERPAILYIEKGEMTEYSSTCSTPIVHHAGESTPELHSTSHWWKNTGKTPAVILSSDLLKVGDSAHMMM